MKEGRLILILSSKSNRNKKKQKNQKNIQEFNSIDLAKLACEVAYNKKGEDIILLDVSKLTIISDYFLIITGNSKPHIQSLAKNIEEKLSELNYKLISKEGISNSGWVVLDFGELIVHIMTEEERTYYKLESFWRNADFINTKLWRKAS